MASAFPPEYTITCEFPGCNAVYQSESFEGSRIWLYKHIYSHDEETTLPDILFATVLEFTASMETGNGYPFTYKEVS